MCVVIGFNKTLINLSFFLVYFSCFFHHVVKSDKDVKLGSPTCYLSSVTLTFYLDFPCIRLVCSSKRNKILYGYFAALKLRTLKLKTDKWVINILPKFSFAHMCKPGFRNDVRTPQFYTTFVRHNFGIALRLNLKMKERNRGEQSYSLRSLKLCCLLPVTLFSAIFVIWFWLSVLLLNYHTCVSSKLISLQELTVCNKIKQH